jgi:hypothetical protein
LDCPDISTSSQIDFCVFSIEAVPEAAPVPDGVRGADDNNDDNNDDRLDGDDKNVNEKEDDEGTIETIVCWLFC